MTLFEVPKSATFSPPKRAAFENLACGNNSHFQIPLEQPEREPLTASGQDQSMSYIRQDATRRRLNTWSQGSVVVPWRPRTFAVAWVHLLTLGTKFAEEKNICYAVTFGPFHCGRDYKQKDAWNVYDAMWLPCGSHLNTQFHFLLHLLALAPTCPCCRQASFYVALRFRSGFRIYKSD